MLARQRATDPGAPAEPDVAIVSEAELLEAVRKSVGEQPGDQDPGPAIQQLERRRVTQILPEPREVKVVEFGKAVGVERRSRRAASVSVRSILDASCTTRGASEQ